MNCPLAFPNFPNSIPIVYRANFRSTSKSTSRSTAEIARQAAILSTTLPGDSSDLNSESFAVQSRQSAESIIRGCSIGQINFSKKIRQFCSSTGEWLSAFSTESHNSSDFFLVQFVRRFHFLFLQKNLFNQVRSTAADDVLIVAAANPVVSASLFFGCVAFPGDR